MIDAITGRHGQYLQRLPDSYAPAYLISKLDAWDERTEKRPDSQTDFPINAW
jgi:hypothetical protein